MTATFHEVGDESVLTSCLAPRPRRSCLSVPASSERKLAKAPTLGADEVILDLEDAVAPPGKDEARERVVATLSEGAEWNGVTVAVRVNRPRSQWCHLDLQAVASLPKLPTSVIVPKVESGGDLAFVDRLLDGAEKVGTRREQIRVQALVETARGLSRVREIARASDRLDALILGYADLATSLGRSAAATQAPESWIVAQETILMAARAHGLQAIDGPHLDLGCDAQFEASARRARELGFDGKWAIHPTHVAVLNGIFAPTAQETDHARRVITALEEAAQAGGQGATTVDGRMIDHAAYVAARRLLARDRVH